MTRSYDLAVVGAGILGLAHALAAARLGKSVVVIDRDAQANGASVRNFGFVTVTGQQRGLTWRRARRSRDIWAEIAPQAGIAIAHRGLVVAAHRQEAVGVIEAFMATEMAGNCRLALPTEALARVPALRAERLKAALISEEDLRVESRTAIPLLACHLEATLGVTFRRAITVLDVAPPVIATSAGPIGAEAAIVCPNDDFQTLFAGRIAAQGPTKCKLHMLRVRPDRSVALGAAVMSDFGLARYEGYAALPEAAPLKARLAAEAPDMLANGIHLIAVQSADGSLVVGDSHHYAPTPDPFAPDTVDALILAELDATLALPGREVVERWTGIYPSGPGVMFMDAPLPAVRLVMVTSGTGASTSFAIAEETVADLYGLAPPPHVAH
ncbi:TIGR03364 family FAD-dependent oxidoreductase [Phreatobacter sp. AB_2022a]|uniref:TIGR03364 family FAD-dependent oxidoreductase n=1 Tax=Phreatobacter sp. AB_2022a TaxID=3003134 RepID=UPI002286EEB8|nr:TIGR03364 family FAD-dependent oxidoreductase [Phreatobacter sp. AB_2022a]MCZ0734108.1 TIGR03364 family FAD-dependent oxidoreductase [Phreatobacter sp. AB_2022a]